MFTTSKRVTRTVAAAAAMAGALSLTACQDDGAKVEGGGTTSAPAPSSSEAPTQAPTQAPTTAPSTSEAPSSSAPETSAPSSSSSSAPSSASADPNAKETPSGSKLKMGQPAIINSGTDSKPKLIKVTPTSLTKAPNSAALISKSSNLKPADGDIWFLKFDVANVKSDDSVYSTTVNGLFFHPKVSSGGKRLYGSDPACDTDSKKLAVGESASGCYIYQVKGSPTDVVYDSYTYDVEWNK